MAPEPAWRSDELLAFTEHDGPGRPPAGGQRLWWCTLAAILGVMVAGMLATGMLPPEHRLGLRFAGAVAMLAAVVAAVGLVRGAALGPLAALAAGLAGLTVGVLDLGIEPSRGRLVIVGFGLTTFIAAWIARCQLAAWRWARQATLLVDSAARSADVAALGSPPSPAGTGASAGVGTEPPAVTDAPLHRRRRFRSHHRATGSPHEAPRSRARGWHRHQR